MGFDVTDNLDEDNEARPGRNWREQLFDITYKNYAFNSDEELVVRKLGKLNANFDVSLLKLF